jgi:hypothetical protein
MASTRSKNTPGDYSLETTKYSSSINYNTYNSYGVPISTFFSSDGLLHGRIASENLSGNSCDIESMLRGIGSTNLVNPLPTISPDIKTLNSLSIIDRLPVFVPRPLQIEPNQRFHKE